MCEYRYRITTEVPIQKGSLVNCEIYHPNADETNRMNWSDFHALTGKEKHPGWTNWSSGTFGSIDECVTHCSQYFPFRDFLNSRIIEVGETKFVRINAQKNDIIDRILLHIEEV